jgi:hypothetical protein
MATAHILPFRYGPSAEQIRNSLEEYQKESEGIFDLMPAINRAMEIEKTAAKLDHLIDSARELVCNDGLASTANRGLMSIARPFVIVDFTSVGPFHQDLSTPLPPLPILEPVRRLKKYKPASDKIRQIKLELTRSRNEIAFHLRNASAIMESTIRTLAEAMEEESVRNSSLTDPTNHF